MMASNNDNDGKNLKRDDMSEGEISDSEPEEKMYCICRTADTNRFMIGCDKCEEWFHGDCISITQEYAKRIQHFYCLMCRDKDPKLEIIFKEAKKPKEKQNKQKPRTESLTENGYSQSFRQFLSSQNKEISSAAKEPDATLNRYERDPDYNPIERKASKRYYESEEDDDDEDYYEPKDSAKNRRGRQVRTEKEEKKDKRVRKQNRSTARSSRHRRKDESNKKTHKKNKEHVLEEDTGPKQCYGPGCINSSRKGSKYCSDECGLKLASNRIYEILPHRIRQWQSTPCDADERSHKSLEAIRTEQQEARRILSELDQKQKELENLISRGKSTPPMTEEESNEAENEADTELNIYCVTCGHEVNQRLVIVCICIGFPLYFPILIIPVTKITTILSAKLKNAYFIFNPFLLLISRFIFWLIIMFISHVFNRICSKSSIGFEQKALKHMERCYNKYESQTSFGSIYKTKIEGQTVFCDAYNPQQRTYCKR